MQSERMNMCVAIRRSQHERLVEVARANERSASAEVRRMLDRYLDGLDRDREAASELGDQARPLSRREP